MSKFEVFKDRTGQWRFHLRASNGEIVFQSEAYHNRADALSTIQSVNQQFMDTHSGIPIDLVDGAPTD